jgi:hypothetical protein
MDIRNFFKRKGDEHEHGQSSVASPAAKQVRVESGAIPCVDTSVSTASSADGQSQDRRTPGNSVQVGEAGGATPEELDVGYYIKLNKTIPDLVKLTILSHSYSWPGDEYDFKQDVAAGARPFRGQWLKDYPWLTYSCVHKGAFCKSCTMFRSAVHRGFQGSFIVTPCTRYKNFNVECRDHQTSRWHLESMASASTFLAISDSSNDKAHRVDVLMSTAVAKQVDDNRKKLEPIVKAILLCGTHDIAIRGKDDESSNFHAILEYRCDAAADSDIFKQHMINAAQNAKYISHRTQNELIECSAVVIRSNIVAEIRNCVGFSVLADESTDVSGTQQLSIGARYFCETARSVKEEFLGFVPLPDATAATISGVIVDSIKGFGLDMSKCVGQGYDGCSTMAGKISGVQQRIAEMFPKALFYHCASHALNLVVNDLNGVAAIRNACGTIKSIIAYIRDSSKRRKRLPSIPLFCETRWTMKYKSIRVFSDNFVAIVDALEEFADNDNNRDLARAYLSACTSTEFIVALCTISKFSAHLEPVANALQKVDIDRSTVDKNIEQLKEMFGTHRDNAEETFSALWKTVVDVADKTGVELSRPRCAKRQTHRANYPSDSVEEYYRRQLYIPYLDSLLASIAERFNKSNEHAGDFNALIPSNLRKMSAAAFESSIKRLVTVYGAQLDNITGESGTWFFRWSKADVTVPPSNFTDTLAETQLHPSIREAIKLALTLPCTTCTIERSFSTMRRVKTWLRSTMSDARLSSLCMLSVHRARVQRESKFAARVMDRFGMQPRRLQLLFTNV